MSAVNWSIDMENHLQDFYLVKSNAELSSDLKVLFGIKISDDSIRRKLKKMGLVRTDEAATLLRVRGASSTWFKSGVKPCTEKEIGTETIRNDHGRPVVWKKVTETKWRQKSHLNWEEKFGKIPPGYVITFMDGNSVNCDVSNLEMITKGENISRNKKRPSLRTRRDHDLAIKNMRDVGADALAERIVRKLKRKEEEDKKKIVSKLNPDKNIPVYIEEKKMTVFVIPGDSEEETQRRIEAVREKHKQIKF